MVNETITDENGTCTITGSGELTVTVTKTGYSTDTKTVNVEEDTTLSFTINRLSRTVSFTIQNSTEEAISGAYITLANSDDETLTYANGNGGTGSSGGSNLSNVAYGTYNGKITYEEEEYMFILTVDEKLSSSSENVEIASDKAVITIGIE